MLSIHAIHHNEAAWPDAQAFKPERFLVRATAGAAAALVPCMHTVVLGTQEHNGVPLGASAPPTALVHLPAGARCWPQPWTRPVWFWGTILRGLQVRAAAVVAPARAHTGDWLALAPAYQCPIPTGPLHCRFAILEAKLALARLFHAFKFTLVPGQQPLQVRVRSCWHVTMAERGRTSVFCTLCRFRWASRNHRSTA